MALNSTERAARRRRDYESMALTYPRQQPHPLLPDWRAYASAADARVGREVTDPSRAAVYTVALRVPSLIAPGRTHSQWAMQIDFSHPSYPRAEPRVTVTSTPRPWTPHFNEAGMVCLGSIWEPGRTMAEFSVDLMRLLNFDEDLRNFAANYGGYRGGEPMKLWRRTMKGRPLNPGLRYPVVRTPSQTTASDVFGPVGGAGGLFGRPT